MIFSRQLIQSVTWFRYEHFSAATSQPFFINIKFTTDKGAYGVGRFVSTYFVVSDCAALNSYSICKFLLRKVQGFTQFLYSFIHGITTFLSPIIIQETEGVNNILQQTHKIILDKCNKLTYNCNRNTKTHTKTRQCFNK